MADSPNTEIERLRHKFLSLETLHEDLGNATVDAKKREIEARIDSLVQTAGGAFVAGGVDTGRDFSGRDQLRASGERSVLIGRDADHLILINGDGNQGVRP